jgi:predicted ATPase
MYLKSVHIRHYKSLDNVSLEFSSPITVLVGPNAVGKSNIVDCLRFVRDAVAADLEHAVSSRGGISRVRQYSKTKPFKVSVRLDLVQEFDEDHPRPALYEFTIESQTGSNYTVDSERAFCFDEHRRDQPLKKEEFTRDKSGAVRMSDEDKAQRVPPDQLALGQRRGLAVPAAWPIYLFIRDWRYSALYPNMLREPASPDKDKVLTEDGRNWASVIKALRRTVRGKAALDRVYEAMKGIIPAFQDVAVTTVGSYLVPRFKFALGAHDTVEFDPVQLSDGTLRVFGILLALYQIPPPKLLVIEEPEQTVHPGVLGVLADAFREAAESTQIIVTTHSPHFIDHFQPEQVRVVTLRNGATTVSQVKKTQLEAVKRRLMSMQDFMLAEGLLPEET